MDRVGYGDEPVQRNDEAVLEAAWVRETGPGLRVDADVFLTCSAPGTNPARPDMVHDYFGPGLERTRRVSVENLPAYLVARKVRQLEFFAEGHLSARRLDVAEAHAARQHLDERVAEAELGFRDLDPFERFAVFGYGHRPHWLPLL
jgi:hypothetical protein